MRPVTVAWHRSRGPDFFAHAAHASRHAGYAVPRELEGVGRSEALAQLLEAFQRHGSAAFRADLDQHSEELLALVDSDDDIDELAARLREAQPAAAPMGQR